MELSDANNMLTSREVADEDGYRSLPSGIGFVAARTEMPGCSAEMIEWWFSNLRTTEQYIRWHPKDHVWCEWKGTETGSYVGGTHHVHERLGHEAVEKLKINFRDPGAVLNTGLFENAGVTAAIYARGGPIGIPIWSGHVLHVIYDESDGCTMRSRFWIGDVSPAIPVFTGLLRKKIASPEALDGLHRHCKEEMSTLASFLPAYYGENK